MVPVGIITAVVEGYFHGTVPEIDLNQAQQQEAIAASAIPFFERMDCASRSRFTVRLRT